MSLDKCPNCGKSLNGFLSSELLSQEKVNFINKYTSEKKETYCSSCSKSTLKKLLKLLKQQTKEIENKLNTILHFIPVISSPAPIKWDYEVIDMVSTQTTSGTGFITELSRSFGDYWGTGSNASNKKIKNATEFCKADLRAQCVKKGGNVVISTDIDFNEVGSGSTNMLMVCMAGTAIRVKEMATFSIKNQKRIIEVMDLAKDLETVIKSTKQVNTMLEE